MTDNDSVRRMTLRILPAECTLWTDMAADEDGHRNEHAEKARDNEILRRIDGQGAEGVELEECDEVVWTEGEDNVKLLFSMFI